MYTLMIDWSADCFPDSRKQCSLVCKIKKEAQVNVFKSFVFCVTYS